VACLCVDDICCRYARWGGVDRYILEYIVLHDSNFTTAVADLGTIEHHTYASTTKVIWISKSLRDLIRSVTLKFQRTPLVEVLCEYVRITFRVNKFPYFPEKIVKHSYPPQPCAENLE